jgi:ADP-ribosylglycohydrolase
MVAQRALPNPPWFYTDDTQMALSVTASIVSFGHVDQDWLVQSAARHFDPRRGYAPGMHRYFAEIDKGTPWPLVASGLFGGQGSFGNGSAMRVAPLGAYFADDLDQVIYEATRQSQVTHAHPEAVAGAVAVAVAAAWACRLEDEGRACSRADFLALVEPSIPDGDVRDGVHCAQALHPDSTVEDAVVALGSGAQATCQDTVPFTLWCAGGHLANYEEAIWTTLSGFGDRDTTCAIVGGIVACYAEPETIPAEWGWQAEPIPDWPFEVDSAEADPA